MNPSPTARDHEINSRTVSYDSASSGSQRFYLAVLLALWLAIYVSSMFTPALLDDADTVHAEAAREMLIRHDWVTLHANGVRYLEKAPLMYWGVAASYKAFGISEWSTRLPLVLGVLALLLVTYWLGDRVYGKTAGFYSALVLATSVGPYLYTRFLIPDILVALWLTLGFAFFLRTLEENPPSRVACWGVAAAAALNVLTKGLIGLVFPIGVMGLYLILTGNLRHILRMRLASSIAVLLAIAAPWHILASLRNPDQGPVRGFLWFYFVNEHFLRYLNKRVPRDYDTVPLILFWVLTVVWIVPWAAFLPQSLKTVPVRWRALRSHLDRQQRANLLFFIWGLLIVVFFSFSTRQEYYSVPALPAFALLIGGWLGRETDDASATGPRRGGRVSSGVLFGIGITAFAVGTFFLFWSKPAPSSDLAELLKRNPNEYALSMGHFLDLTPEALGAFRGPLLAASLSLLLGTGVNWYLRRHGAPRLGNYALAAMMVVLLLAVHSALVVFSPILSSKKLALFIEQHYRPGDTVVVRGLYENASTLNFYTGVHLLSMHQPTGNMWYGSKFPDAPAVWESPEGFAQLWAGESHVFLWTDLENPPELRGKRAYVLAHSGGKYIYTNWPAQP
ncbi:MAG TPA: glycosyltransferase family 39 protein [Terriglobales bacterium]|nr:glycosyltransferase family 39 protein [Terriglobales bacterium]